MRLMRSARPARADAAKTLSSNVWRNRGALGRAALSRGRMLAGESAAHARRVAGEAAYSASDLAPRRREEHHHGRALAVGMALGVTVVAGTAAYLWWRNHRRDGEFARLVPEPQRPDVAPAAPDDGPAPTVDLPSDEPAADMPASLLDGRPAVATATLATPAQPQPQPVHSSPQAVGSQTGPVGGARNPGAQATHLSHQAPPQRDARACSPPGGRGPLPDGPTLPPEVR